MGINTRYYIYTEIVRGEEMETKIKSYKGFDENLKCRGFQYEIGKEYEEPDAAACQKGFHACEDPIETFGHYPPAMSRYCEVEQNGKISRDSDDSKVASSKIKIGAEIGIKGIIEAGVKLRIERCTYSGESVTTGYQAGAQATGDQAGAQATGNQAGAQATGYQAGAQATGNQAGAQATGDQAGAQATGDYGSAFADGTDAVASAIGYKCRAKGTLGTMLVLIERGDFDGKVCPIIGIKTVRVDDKDIKSGVWYVLEDGEIKEANDEDYGG